jgi:hypothetical protein
MAEMASPSLAPGCAQGPVVPLSRGRYGDCSPNETIAVRLTKSKVSTI